MTENFNNSISNDSKNTNAILKEYFRNSELRNVLLDKLTENAYFSILVYNVSRQILHKVYKQLLLLVLLS